MNDLPMPELDLSVVTDRFQSILIKHGPPSTDGTKVRITPMPTIVGEMCRQFLCLFAEFDSGCPSFELTSDSVTEDLRLWFIDYCHAHADLITPLMSDGVRMFVRIAYETGLSFPAVVLNDIASEIVGYHDYLRDLNGGEA